MNSYLEKDFELLKNADCELFEAFEKEQVRQSRNIELIASENYTSAAVMAASGSIFTNKYAEGYPSRRYYGGCEYVDIAEDLAIERLKKLFGCEYANVQPHSGSQANFAVYFALLQPGDTVLGMSLADGGHLTHGSPVNVSGSYFDFQSYGVDEKGFLDYDALEKKAKECNPKLIVAGASAYSRIIDFKRIREIADSVGALFMVDMAHIAGLVASDMHPSPVPYAHVVTSTTHKTLRGPRGGIILTMTRISQKRLTRLFSPVFRVVLLCTLLLLKQSALVKRSSLNSRNMVKRLFLTVRLLKMHLLLRALTLFQVALTTTSYSLT